MGVRWRSLGVHLVPLALAHLLPVAKILLPKQTGLSVSLDPDNPNLGVAKFRLWMVRRLHLLVGNWQLPGGAPDSSPSFARPPAPPTA